MEHKSRDTIVGLFAIVSLFCFGWMVFKFGDLPGFVSKMDASQINIEFSEIPGIQVNSAVYFRGYSIGKVIEITPPQPRSNNTDGTIEYLSLVKITISNDYKIPANIQPKIFQKSLGSSYIELVLQDMPSEELLADNATLRGKMSTASQFISEKTQNQLDNLIVSLNKLSVSMEKQFSTTTPSDVDKNQEINANLTTAIIRFDNTLKNLNTIIGNSENQENLKNILSELAIASKEARKLIVQTQDVVKNTDLTVKNIDSYAKQLSDSYIPVADNIQVVADEITNSFKTLNNVISKANDGKGTIDRLLNDPDLYESLTDTAERLSLALQELQKTLSIWQEKGIKMKL